jgi:hypothetical protein
MYWSPVAQFVSRARADARGGRPGRPSRGTAPPACPPVPTWRDRRASSGDRCDLSSGRRCTGHPALNSSRGPVPLHEAVTLDIRRGLLCRPRVRQSDSGEIEARQVVTVVTAQRVDLCGLAPRQRRVSRASPTPRRVHTRHARAAQPKARASEAPLMGGVRESADSTVGRRPRPPRSAPPLAPALSSIGAIEVGDLYYRALRVCCASAVCVAGCRREGALFGSR